MGTWLATAQTSSCWCAPAPTSLRWRRRWSACEPVSRRSASSSATPRRLPVSVSAGICAYPEHARIGHASCSRSRPWRSARRRAVAATRVRVAQVGEEERVLSGSFDVLQGLVIAVDNKDRYTKRHSEDVARYAVFLAERLGLDEEMRETIHLSGLLHDVGKIGIPDVVLRKPSKLTADEYGMFQQHVVLGDAIVRDVPTPWQLSQPPELATRPWRRIVGSSRRAGFRPPRSPLACSSSGRPAGPERSRGSRRCAASAEVIIRAGDRWCERPSPRWVS